MTTEEKSTSYRPSSVIVRRREAARRRLLIQRRRTIAFVVLGGIGLAALAAVLSAFGGESRRPPAARQSGLSVAATHVRLLRPSQLAPNENRAVDRVLAYTPFISRGGAHHREVALTFDDGPGPYTHRVVSVLRRLHARATFFQVGVMIPTFHGPGSEVRRYFPVGDHTISHPLLGRLPKARQREEILGDVPRLASERVPMPRLFRPPYASFNRDTMAVLRAARMLMVLWSVDSRDYLRPGTKAIIHNVLSQVRPGSIVLMHDAGGDRRQTVAALPTIIRKLRRRHFKLVTVPQMLVDAPPAHAQPKPPGTESGGVRGG